MGTRSGRFGDGLRRQRAAVDQDVRAEALREFTITRCAWAEIYYQAHRAKDHSHARALLCLGQRWLKIIHGLLLLSKSPSEPALKLVFS